MWGRGKGDCKRVGRWFNEYCCCDIGLLGMVFLVFF